MQPGSLAEARAPGCVPNFGGGSTDGLTGRDIVELVRLCSEGENEVAARFAGVYGLTDLAEVDARELDPLQRPAGGRLKRPRDGTDPRVPSYMLDRGERNKKEDKGVQCRGRKREDCGCRRTGGRRCVLVVNTFRHWVTVCLDTKIGVLYLDSLGEPPKEPSVRKFLKRMCRDVLHLDPDKHTYYSSRQVQDMTSNYCGMFAALWCICLSMTAGDSRKDLRDSVVKAKIKFFKAASRLRENDKLCGDYLRKLGEVNSLGFGWNRVQ